MRHMDLEAQGSFRQRAVPAQVDVQRLMGDVSLGSSPSIGQGMGTLGMGSGMMGQPGMSSMGSAPTPRALVQSSAFASSQSLQNRNLSDLGSYLELLSLARGQDQVSFPRYLIQSVLDRGRAGRQLVQPLWPELPAREEALLCQLEAATFRNRAFVQLHRL